MLKNSFVVFFMLRVAQTSSPTFSHTVSTDLGTSRRQLVPIQSSSPQTSSKSPSSRRAVSALDIHHPKDRDEYSLESSRSPSTIGKVQQRPIRIVPPPAITPRTNKSAALRAAKMEAQARSHIAVGAVANKAPRAPRPSTSSLKPIVA